MDFRRVAKYGNLNIFVTLAITKVSRIKKTVYLYCLFFYNFNTKINYTFKKKYRQILPSHSRENSPRLFMVEIGYERRNMRNNNNNYVKKVIPWAINSYINFPEILYTTQSAFNWISNRFEEKAGGITFRPPSSQQFYFIDEISAEQSTI